MWIAVGRYQAIYICQRENVANVYILLFAFYVYSLATMRSAVNKLDENLHRISWNVTSSHKILTQAGLRASYRMKWQSDVTSDVFESWLNRLKNNAWRQAPLSRQTLIEGYVTYGLPKQQLSIKLSFHSDSINDELQFTPSMVIVRAGARLLMTRFKHLQRP